MDFSQRLAKIRMFFLFERGFQSLKSQSPKQAGGLRANGQKNSQAPGSIKGNILRHFAAAAFACLGAGLLSGCGGSQRPAARQGSEAPPACEASKPRSNKTASGDTLFHQAARSHDLKLAECLLGLGADPNAQNDEGESPILLLSARDESDTSEFLAGGAKILQYIISNFEAADIDAVSEKHFQTPLQRAVLTGHDEAAKILIQSGADIHKKSEGENPQSAFDLAKLQDRADILELMKTAGSKGPVFEPADPNPSADEAQGQPGAAEKNAPAPAPKETADPAGEASPPGAAMAEPEPSPKETGQAREESQGANPENAAAEAPEPAPAKTADPAGEASPPGAAMAEPEPSPKETGQAREESQGANPENAAAAAEPAPEETEPGQGASPPAGPWLPTNESIARGGEVYQINCAMCHGPGGLGDAPAAAAFNPPPRNLVEGQWTNGGSSKELFITLRDGIAGSPMTPFKHLSPEDRWALVHYIRSITENMVEDDPEDLAEFAKGEAAKNEGS